MWPDDTTIPSVILQGVSTAQPLLVQFGIAAAILAILLPPPMHVVLVM